MNRVKFVLFGTILMSALMVLPLVGCAPSGAPREKYVTFLSLTDLTGPAAGFTVPLEDGFRYYFSDLNSAGGVNGVMVKHISVDTRYDVARTASAFKRYRNEHKLHVMFVPQTAANKALAPQIEADRLISMTPADGEFQARPGRIFLVFPPYQDGFAASIDWIINDWKSKGNPGKPKVGYMHWDNPMGKEPLRGGKEYAEKAGVTLLSPEFFPQGSLDHSVWLMRINDAGANYCIIGGVDPTPSLVLRDAYKLGLTKKIQFVDATYLGLDEVVGVRLHPEATEGAVICSPYLRGDEIRNHPLVAQLWSKHSNRPISDMGAVFPGPLVMGRDFVQALKTALEKTSYEKLDGDDMYRAYQALTGFDRLGLMGPCAYSTTSRRSSQLVKFYQVKSGKTVPITDWSKPPDAVSLYPNW